MAENSKIEWCHATFNPWLGCEKVSPACDHCYAEGWAKRTGQAHLWSGERRRTTEAYWRGPLKWNAAAEAAGVRRRVFCASLADVFDDQVPDEWRADLWRLIDECQSLDWLLLTKRPKNAARMIIRARQDVLGSRKIVEEHVNWPWPNVWIGTTVESQDEARQRIPQLLKVPAAIRFLSCEPLLGPLDLTRIDLDGYSEIYPLEGTTECEYDDGAPAPDLPALDWVICGGESGPHARMMQEEWAGALMHQCASAEVPFFMKQIVEHGKKVPFDQWPEDLKIREFPNVR